MVANSLPASNEALNRHAERYRVQFVNDQPRWLNDALAQFLEHAEADETLLQPNDAFATGVVAGLHLAFMDIAMSLANGEVTAETLIECTKQ